eukprot:XP_011681203.1 PREDICTED: uncharacterized protein LOC105446291 [Strongylocentrotus purpuratus]
MPSVHIRRSRFLFLLLRYTATVFPLLFAIGNFSLVRCASIGREYQIMSSVEAAELNILYINGIPRSKREIEEKPVEKPAENEAEKEVPPDHVIPSKSYRPYGRWAKFKFNFLEIGIVIVAVVNVICIACICNTIRKLGTGAQKTVQGTKKYAKKYAGIADDEEEEEEEEEEGEDDDD